MTLIPFSLQAHFLCGWTEVFRVFGKISDYRSRRRLKFFFLIVRICSWGYFIVHICISVGGLLNFQRVFFLSFLFLPLGSYIKLRSGRVLGTWRIIHLDTMSGANEDKDKVTVLDKFTSVNAGIQPFPGLVDGILPVPREVFIEGALNFLIAKKIMDGVDICVTVVSLRS